MSNDGGAWSTPHTLSLLLLCPVLLCSALLLVVSLISFGRYDVSFEFSQSEPNKDNGTQEANASQDTDHPASPLGHYHLGVQASGVLDSIKATVRGVHPFSLLGLSQSYERLCIALTKILVTVLLAQRR